MSMTPEVRRHYIDHLQKVIPKVVEADGAASGYWTSLTPIYSFSATSPIYVLLYNIFTYFAFCVVVATMRIEFMFHHRTTNLS